MKNSNDVVLHVDILGFLDSWDTNMAMQRVCQCSLKGIHVDNVRKASLYPISRSEAIFGKSMPRPSRVHNFKINGQNWNYRESWPTRVQNLQGPIAGYLDFLKKKSGFVFEQSTIASNVHMRNIILKIVRHIENPVFPKFQLTNCLT